MMNNLLPKFFASTSYSVEHFLEASWYGAVSVWVEDVLKIDDSIVF